MRKFSVLTSTVLLSSCVIFSQDKGEFKNPLFDLPLEPIATSSGYTYIYPTLIEYRGVVDKDKIIGVGKCQMVENKMDRVTLKCQIKYDIDVKFRELNYHTFVLKGKMGSNCIRVEEQIRDLNVGYSFDAPLSSQSNYCIKIPDDISPK